MTRVAPPPSRRGHLRPRASLPAALPILAAALLAPATFGQATEDAFGEVIDVRVVNLEVVVTENGERVRNLEPEDFIIEVNDKEVPVEYFTEVFGGSAVVPSEDVAGAVPALAPGEVVSTSYLLFIDNFFSITRDRDQVLDGLIEQLPNMQPEDRMAVVAYDGKTVEMLANWSTSQRDLTRTLKQSKNLEARGLQRLAEERAYDTRRLLERRDQFTGGELLEFAVGLEQEEEQYALLLSQQVQGAVKAASATLRGFANPPGRKVMILLSGGWPNDPTRYVVTDPARAITLNQSQVVSGRQLLRPLVETANLLSYSLYPIDVPGLWNRDFDIVDQTVEDGELRRNESALREDEVEFALLDMASQTGGRALIDGARTAAFERIVADTRSYYWLGFTPDWQGDDTEHEVKVRMRDRGLKARSRKGYADLSRQTEVTLMVESALRFGEAPAAVPLVAEVGRGKRSGWGKREVPLSLQIPMDQVTFLPQSEGLVAQLELRVAVLDERGNEAEVPVVPLTFLAKGQPEDGARATYETSLRLRNDPHDVVVSIYDRASGKIMSTKVQVAKF
ncbi:MAG: VWA domain-containing protein [Acidobacteriota bacterium]